MDMPKIRGLRFGDMATIFGPTAWQGSSRHTFQYEALSKFAEQHLHAG